MDLGERRCNTAGNCRHERAPSLAAPVVGTVATLLGKKEPILSTQNRASAEIDGKKRPMSAASCGRGTCAAALARPTLTTVATVLTSSTGQALRQAAMTSAEFLAWDANEPARHEFVRGDVFAMAGASECHIVVTGNLFVALRAHLRGTPCRPLMTDMKLRVEAADCFFYPDLMVTCEPPSPHNEFVKTDAKLVVEVLSPTTAAYDRGEKFASYRQLLPQRRPAQPDERHRLR